MLRVIESFSGIGAQTQALKNAQIPHEIVNTIEWEIGAIFAYDILHNGTQDLRIYRHHNKTSLIEEISQYNISSDGKSPMTVAGLNRMPMILLKAVIHAIERNKNLVDIKSVNHHHLEQDVDLFTYSFPCQDLSVSSHFWNNNKGINRDSDGQSSLLWEIERILSELIENSQKTPTFLLMENVSAILSKNHIDNFNIWLSFLEENGYYNQLYTLNARDFNIPQNRTRTYLISTFTDHDARLNGKLEEYFFHNNLENYQVPLSEHNNLSHYLRLNYSDKDYLDEALSSTPEFTPSRQKIYENNICLAVDDEVNINEVARTITTKQDRNPNSGLIHFSEGNELISGRPYRNLTPRETFLLMGFSEDQYNLLLENNLQISKNRRILSESKLLQLSGNSIVVNVLEKIFLQIEDIKENILFK